MKPEVAGLRLLGLIAIGLLAGAPAAPAATKTAAHKTAVQQHPAPARPTPRPQPGAGRTDAPDAAMDLSHALPGGALAKATSDAVPCVALAVICLATFVARPRPDNPRGEPAPVQP